MNERVTQALNAIRDAVANAFAGLTKDDYIALLDALAADAEGWNMELQEAESVDEDPDP